MDNLMLDEDIHVDPAALSEIFSTLNPSIVRQPTSSERIVLVTGSRSTSPTSPFDASDEDDPLTQSDQEESDVDLPPSIEDDAAEKPDPESEEVPKSPAKEIPLESRMKLQKEISDLQSNIASLQEIEAKLSQSDAFDPQDIEQVQKRREEVEAQVSEKKARLSMFGEKMQCCREMQQKLQTRLHVLRECETILDFRKNKSLAEFFAKKHIRLRELLEKLNSL